MGHGVVRRDRRTCARRAARAATRRDRLATVDGRQFYLDACAIQRPFDDLSRRRVRLEAAAVDRLLRSPDRVLVWSAYLDAECFAPEVPADRRRWATAVRALATIHVAASRAVEARAVELGRLVGLRPFDALHVAAAESAKATFVTTDRRTVLGRVARKPGVVKVRCIPPEFVRRIAGGV